MSVWSLHTLNRVTVLFSRWHMSLFATCFVYMRRKKVVPVGRPSARTVSVAFFFLGGGGRRSRVRIDSRDRNNGSVRVDTYVQWAGPLGFP